MSRSLAARIERLERATQDAARQRFDAWASKITANPWASFWDQFADAELGELEASSAAGPVTAAQRSAWVRYETAMAADLAQAAEDVRAGRLAVEINWCGPIVVGRDGRDWDDDWRALRVRALLRRWVEETGQPHPTTAAELLAWLTDSAP